MTKALFGFPRATAAYTLSAGQWQATYPLINLQNLPLSRVARSQSALTTSTVLLATATQPQLAGMVGLVRHNLSSVAQIRLSCWAEAARLNVTYSGPWESVWPAGYQTMTAAEQANAVWTWYKRFSVPGSPGVTVGALEIEINDPGNPAGFVQGGYLEIAQVFETHFNFEWGFQYGFAWRSQVTEALGGAEYVDRRQKPRIVRGNFPNTLRSESMTKFFEMWRQLDMSVPLLFVPMPDEITHYPRTVMFARQVDPGMITMRTTSQYGLLDSVPVALREIIG
jgi:hypothetical protein